VIGYVLSTAAEEDLTSIWDYIARDSVDAADQWVAKLFVSFETLADNPAIGHRREDLTGLPVLF
jgi:plasmid stabilization system protein ParE